MRNPHLWKPSKFLCGERGLLASPDPSELGVRSRMIGAKLAIAYWRMIREHANGTLGDVGCGKVPLYEAYRDLVTEVICVDWENTWHSNPHVDIEADLNAGLPFPDQGIDTLLATDVLEHLARPDVFWSEASRVLRTMGKVLVGVPFLYYIHEEPHDHFRYTEYRLRAFCSENRLSIVLLEPYAGPLAVVLDIIGKNVPGRRVARWYQASANWFLTSRLGSRIDARNSELFPLGYCLVAQKAAPAV